jgi:hypothetical protein
MVLSPLDSAMMPFNGQIMKVLYAVYMSNGLIITGSSTAVISALFVARALLEIAA